MCASLLFKMPHEEATGYLLIVGLVHHVPQTLITLACILLILLARRASEDYTRRMNDRIIKDITYHAPEPGGGSCNAERSEGWR